MNHPQEYPFLPLAGGTMTGTLNMNSNNITNGGDITAAHANGYYLENAAASSTNPTIVPNRASATTGLSDTGIIVAGTRILAATASDILFNSPTNGVQYISASGSEIYLAEHATTSLTTNGGAGTQTATGLIPAGSLVYGVVARVTTAITGCTTFSIGVSGADTNWGTGIAVAANTTTTGANFVAGWQPTNYASATDVVLTAAGGGGVFTTGVVRLMVYYVKFDAPTS